jgi:hypothetical protein
MAHIRTAQAATAVDCASASACFLDAGLIPYLCKVLAVTAFAMMVDTFRDTS